MIDNRALVAAANTEPKVHVIGQRTGREFTTTEFTYGVLVPDNNHPLSCVSVANSALSIDLWIGCKWQCAYCHVQGSNQDLAENGAMPRKVRRRNDCTVDEIVEALIEHPFFVPDETFISIGTASTEPFAPGVVINSTFEIMEAFIQQGFKNPFWIVTKRGVPKGYKKAFERIVQATKGLMISLCWADNPGEIEPVKNNRFANAEEAREAGAVLTWYMRPLAPEWSGTREGVEKMMLHVKESYGHLISAIVPGGLRWTEGIENGMTEVRNLSAPTVTVYDDNDKDLSYELAQDILDLAGEHFPGMPVYFKSSCALTHMLEVASISSVQAFAKRECEMSVCPAAQRDVCTKGRIFGMSLQDAQEVLDRLSVPARATGWSTYGMLVTEPSLDTFTYALRQVVINNLGRGE